jgi:hypothetical protein
MDLNYPSSKIKNLSNQLNNIDRRFGSIILSNPKIDLPLKIINNKLKKKCIYYIRHEEPGNLIHFIKQKHILLTDEISKEGYGWTILHHVAKSNSSACMNYCLRWLYQSSPATYEQTVNQKNC